MLARLAASPLMSPASPSTSTATSACFAAATASANPADAVSVMPQPFAYATLTLPARALIPSRGVTASRGSPRPGQEPSAETLSSARGPITAMVFTLAPRSEEHTSELQSHSDLVCRLLLEKKKNIHIEDIHS